MKIIEEYIIYWKCDSTEEVYDSQEERNGRINTLQNQGYEIGVDFEIFTRYLQIEHKTEAEINRNSRFCL